MDLLFKKYANPMESISLYINRGRFGEFVTHTIEQENDRIRKEAEKDEDWKLWTLFLHASSGESFADWKKKVLKNSEQKPKRGRDENLTDEGIKSIINKLFPN